MRALLLHEDGLCAELDVHRGLQALYTALSTPTGACSNVEALPIFPPRPGRPDATLYIDGEGKFTGRPLNPLATMWLQENNLLFPQDYVAGPILAIGFDPRRGENLTLPSEIEVLPWPRPQGAQPWRA